MKKNIKNEKIIRAVLYIRVSTEEQVRHGYSLNSQRERLIEYCKQLGYQVVNIYVDEGKTARTKLRNRKALLQLLEDAKEHSFDRIVIWRLDRWFRNVADYYKVQEILEENKIDWECSDEEYDNHTSNGRLHLNIKLSIAQNESDQTSDRIKFNFNSMVKNGRAITGTHAVPLGYMVAGEEKNKRVVKNPETEQIAIDMLSYVRMCGSIRQTVLYINEKYNLNICYDSMRHYLLNTKYYGHYRGVDNYCEAYIKKEEFDEIQSLLRKNVKLNKRYDYIFTGLLKCPKCGCKLSGITTKITKKNNKEVDYKYPGYRCNHSYNDNLCTYRKKVGEAALEEYLLSNIKKEIQNHIFEIENITTKEAVKKVIDVNKVKIRLGRLTDLYLDGKILREKYDEEFEKLNALLHESEEIKIEEPKDLSKYKEFLETDILKVYNTLENKFKRMLWAKYIDYITKDENDEYHIYFK